MHTWISGNSLEEILTKCHEIWSDYVRRAGVLGSQQGEMPVLVVVGWAPLWRMLAFVPYGSHPEPVSPGSDSHTVFPSSRLPVGLCVVFFI